MKPKQQPRLLKFKTKKGKTVTVPSSMRLKKALKKGIFLGGQPRLKPCNCQESWKPVIGFESRYEISSKGQVRSWVKGRGINLKEPYIRKCQTDKDGYRYLILYDKPRVKGYRVSQLVLICFIGPKLDKMEASHIDGNKENNCVCNLKWETRRENEDRKITHKTRPMGESSGTSKLTEKDVLFIRSQPNEAGLCARMGRMFNISLQTAYHIRTRHTWKHI